MKLVSGGRSTSDCVKLLVFGLINSSIELLFSATSIAGFAMLRSFGDSNSPIELLFSDWCTSRKFSEEPV